MVESIVSLVAERLSAITKDPIQDETKLLTTRVKEISNLSDELNAIKCVLPDAERRRFWDENVRNWLSKLQDRCREMEDVLDEWENAILELKVEQEKPKDAVVASCKKEVCSSIPSSCLCFKKFFVGGPFFKKFRIVKEQLHQLFLEKDQHNFSSEPTTKKQPAQSTSVSSGKVYCRDADRDILVSKLTANGGRQEQSGIHILGIVGVGGIGKTVLARLVSEDSRVRQSFDLRIWVCVSELFDEIKIAKEISKSTVGKGSSDPNNNQLEMLRDSVSGKKFLLVLDGVCTVDKTKWEALENSLKGCGVGSKVLVTTRNQRVARIMSAMDNDIHRLGQLSDTDCWSLLWALSGKKEEEREEFEEVGKGIAIKCTGLPLVAKTLGGLLNRKNSLGEWTNVLHTQISEVEGVQADVFPNLNLTYNELPTTLKQCFLYCYMFSRNLEIEVEKLIESWIALGYLGSTIVGGFGSSDIEVRGREYFDELANSFLFEDFKKSDLDGQIKTCKMNGIVHAFAKWKIDDETNGTEKANCRVCNLPKISSVKEYRSLFRNDETATSLCDCLELASLRVMGIRCGLLSIPQGMEKLIRLRWLDLSDNKLSREDARSICKLMKLQFLSFNADEVPIEIKNLIHLRHLDLSSSGSLRELPESICGLQELRTLNLNFCRSLSKLPQEIHRLKNLKHLRNLGTSCLKEYPKGLPQLTGLHTLNEYCGGSGWSKLGWLKNLNQLSGSLTLNVNLIDVSEDVVEDAKEAEMSQKIHIHELIIKFDDKMNEENDSVLRMDVIDALEPHPNLQKLHVWFYKCPKLPDWITSLNQLREVHLYNFNHMLSLPSLGKLPSLEEIYVFEMGGLQSVGQEFLGLTTAEGGETSSMVGFPKLKELTFNHCPKWKEWEDITAEQGEDAAVSLMPCLMKLNIIGCYSMAALPNRLLRKASSLEELSISFSINLQQSYHRDKDGFAWKSITQNPRLRFIL